MGEQLTSDSDNLVWAYCVGSVVLIGGREVEIDVE
jgi:hypothetical protein